MAAVRAPTGHEDLIHDAQLDYYGLRLATCSSDRVVKIFDIISENGAAPKVQFSCDLLGHTGAVWEVAWAHPRWGNLLASCSYDASVIIHRFNDSGSWEEAFRHTARGSVNSIEWCPYEYGLALACASSDGNVYILRCDLTTGVWACECEILAHRIGCNSVTWAPYGALGSLENDRFILRIATGGSDQKVRIFKCVMEEATGSNWMTEPERDLEHHQDWVRDVAWAPSIGLPYNLLASCSEDGTVCIWSQEKENEQWSKEVLPNFKAPVWRVAWSITGSLLAVSAGDSDVTLWKESLEEKKWVRVSEIKDKIPPAQSTPTADIGIPRTEVATSPRNVNAQPEPVRQEIPVSSQPITEDEKPSMTWQNPPAQEEAPPETQQWPSQPEGQPQEPESSAASEDAGAAQQTEQQGTEGGQSYDTGASAGYEGYGYDQQQYDGQQTYAEGQGYDEQQQYYQGGEYDYSQQQQYYNDQQQGGEGQYWDPNQQGQYWDPNQQGQQGEEWSAHPDQSQYEQQAPAANYGLAAPPVHAGATYNLAGQQQSAYPGDQGQQQQQPW